MRECKKCGSTFDEQLRMCPECGTDVPYEEFILSNQINDNNNQTNSYGYEQENTSSYTSTKMKLSSDNYSSEPNNSSVNNNTSYSQNGYNGTNYSANSYNNSSYPINNHNPLMNNNLIDKTHQESKVRSIILSVTLAIIALFFAFTFLKPNSGDGFSSKEEVLTTFLDAYKRGDLDGYTSVYPEYVRENMSTSDKAGLEMVLNYISSGELTIIDYSYDDFVDVSSAELTKLKNALKTYSSKIGFVKDCMKITVTVKYNYTGYGESEDSFDFYVFRLGKQWYGCDPME